jgi:predicted MFS family arabinose efflux permease
MPKTTSTRYVLVLLLAVNLLNYIDRQALYAVFPLVKADFALSDTSLGLIGSAFMLCYMVTAPIFGWFGDRCNRSRLAAVGLSVWSAATALSGMATGYISLLTARSAVGIGEASFGSVSPPLLSDYVSEERRGRILSYFFLAIPVGSALGYLLGGVLGQQFGWRAAFLMVGLPGLLLTIPLWLLKDPRPTATTSTESARPDYRLLLRNRSFIVNTLAMAAMTFALGGLAQWVPSFLVRTHALDVAKANTLFGGITVVSGIIGTALGGWLGDRLQKRTPSGYLLVAGAGFLAGAPVAVVAIMTKDLTTALVAIFVAECLIFLNTGPLNAVIVNVSPPTIRAMAFAVNIFFIHALGDAISPAIIGMLSDRFGLAIALLVTPLALVIAAGYCFLCTRFIAADSTP